VLGPLVVLINKYGLHIHWVAFVFSMNVLQISSLCG